MTTKTTTSANTGKRGGRRSGAERPKGTRDKSAPERVIDDEALAELARSRALDALDALSEVMSDSSAPATARVVAAKAMLDRGYGRPAQRRDSNEDPSPATAEVVRLIHPNDPDFEPLS